MELDLAGRVALVNAASRGLGRACAEALAGEGVSLVVCSRDATAIEKAAAELSSAHGVEVLAVASDVAAAGSAERLARTALERFGRLDILVNNSGGPPSGRFADFGDDAWQQAFELLLLSVVRMVRACHPALRASGQGRIVNIVSTTVRQPSRNLVLSNSLRAGVVALAKTLSNELAPDRITVNSVLPGRLLTDRLREGFLERASRERLDVDELARSEVAKEIPLGRVGEPIELGRLVAYLASDAAAYLTGQMIAVDGGQVAGLF